MHLLCFIYFTLIVLPVPAFLSFPSSFPPAAPFPFPAGAAFLGGIYGSLLKNGAILL